MPKDFPSIAHYFPELTTGQVARFTRLVDVYNFWNAQINVISRKDMDNFYLHHVLHSLAISQVIKFKPGSEILDVGTGGGFPGIPLAIMFPDVKFHLVDSIGKKIKVVSEVANALQLKNVTWQQVRADEMRHQYDFIVSRAVGQWNDLHSWTARLLKKKSEHELANGWILLKGGDLKDEFRLVTRKMVEYPISNYFKEDFFETKKVIYIPNAPASER
ncbi:MAG: 16S rRNA (guanine(527)-N(7))-methyltransferase RsmG [Bacteroidetes bacterium]|jgi:16S rRNA (guanine527-N7)-methyltransferase|nr:16S rRNA (guanine(527)-N(7))-methyltransferase RsmG [Bacteroidota bacterium]